MGNLVNATSTRLGWFQNWNDSWYADPLYYGEYLYAFFRMRYYLVYFYGIIEKRKKRFYSHYFLSRICNNVSIEIYYYDSAFCQKIVDLEIDCFEILEDYLSDIRLKNLNSKKINAHHTTLFFLCAGGLFKFFRYISKKWLKRRNFKEAFSKYLINLGSFLFTTDVNSKPDYLLKAKKTQNKRYYYNSYFLVIFIAFYKVFLECLDSFNKPSSEFFTEFVSLYNMMFNWSRIITGESIILSYVFSKMTCFEYFKYSFYLLSNNEVTGAFLSRFIAKRVALGVNIRTTLNPIKGDLSLVHRILLRESLNVFSKTSLKWSIALSNYKIFFKVKWYKFLCLFLFISRHVFFSNYINTRSWLSYDNFLFLKWLYKSYSRNSNKKKMLRNKNLVFFTRKYWITRNGFLIYFLNKWGNTSFLKTKIFIYFKNIFDSFINIMNYNYIFVHKDFSSLYNYIIIDVFINFNSLLNLSYENGLDFSRVQFINLNYNVFMFNSFLGFSYKAFFLKKNIVYLNAVKARSYKNKKKKSLLKGFKFRCSGRFSRRQRAGSLWYLRGRVPLNTFSVEIDYGSYNIAIDNSEICIKVWLNVEGREFLRLPYEAISQ